MGGGGTERGGMWVDSIVDALRSGGRKYGACRVVGISLCLTEVADPQLNWNHDLPNCFCLGSPGLEY